MYKNKIKLCFYYNCLLFLDVNGVSNHVGSNSGCSSSVLSIPSSSPRPNGLDDASMSSSSSFVRSTKATPMHIRHKFGQLGSGKGHFNSPHGFCLGNEEDIIVADTNNHRISVCIYFNLLLVYL